MQVPAHTGISRIADQLDLRRATGAFVLGWLREHSTISYPQR